jgi:hypothetical protein
LAAQRRLQLLGGDLGQPALVGRIVGAAHRELQAGGDHRHR